MAYAQVGQAFSQGQAIAAGNDGHTDAMRLQKLQPMTIEGIEGFGLLSLVAVMQAALCQHAIHIEHQQFDGFRFF